MIITMKITKARLKEIIKQELVNLEEYSPYKTGARPDKPHKKPGETKDDGKYADPKRARPKKRYEEQQEEEVEENVRVGRRPRLQRDRAPSDDLYGYDPGVIELRQDFKEIGLDLSLEPSPEEKRFLVSRIDKKLRRNPDKETIEKLRKLKSKLKDFTSQEEKDERKYRHTQHMKYRMNEELTRQDKTDVKKMVKDELGKLLKKKDTKDQMGEIVKKIMKKLYKDLSLEHPYIIDRIKI